MSLGQQIQFAIAWLGITIGAGLCASAVILVLVWGQSLVACSPAQTKASAEAAYTAEHLECVDKATTREESTECRRRVDAKWGITDGGPNASDSP